MKYAALKLPGSDEYVPNIPGFKIEPTLAGVVNSFLGIIFYLAAFLAFFWLVWGAFQYLFAGGNKEELAKARARITYAVIGLIIVILSFAMAQFVQQVLKPQRGTPITLVSTSYAVDIGREFAFGDIRSLGQGTNRLIAPAFSIAAAGVVIYFLIGAFKFLTSGGDKNQVAGAREMITHAIIGFIILMFAFFILQFVLSNLFGIKSLRIIEGV